MRRYADMCQEEKINAGSRQTESEPEAVLKICISKDPKLLAGAELIILPGFEKFFLLC